MIELKEIIKERTRIYNDNIDVLSVYREGVHGIDHIINVLYFVELLSKKMSLSVDDIKILKLAALYHDIGRTNDDIDETHGFKSYRVYREEEKQDPYVQYLIEQHPINDAEALESVKYYDVDIVRAQELLKIFKDCDGLDRFRLGDFVKGFIRKEESLELIEIAEECNNPYIWITSN